jgi:ATP-binding cassette, subfamily C, bacterial CydC
MSTSTSASSRTAVLSRCLRVGTPQWGRLGLACLLGIVGAACTIALLAGSGALLGRAAFRPGLGAIAGLLAAVEVVAIARGPIRYAERLVGHDAAFRALSQWRVWLYDRLEPLSPAGLRAWRTGDVLTTAVQDVDSLQDLYLREINPVVIALCTAALGVTAVGLLVPMAALVLAIALAVALVGVPVLAVCARAEAEREAALHGQLGADVVDTLQGASELLAYGCEQATLAGIDQVGVALARCARRRAASAGASAALLMLCLGGGIVGILAVTAAAVHGHRLAPVDAAVLPLAAFGTFEVLPGIALAAARAGGVLAAARRLFAFADTPPPIADPVTTIAIPPGPLAVGLDEVRLRYADDLPWALNGLTFALDPGVRLALTGASGAGKSSVVNLLLRYWPASSGRATLGDISLDDLAQQDVRRVIGLLPQDADLFGGTIRTNIMLGRPDATHEQLARVVQIAQLQAWVGTLPDGLDTSVGDRGSRVSGGQRQRIALARMLIAEPAVLVLDEPTAGLDVPTADALLTDVLATARPRSVLLVTHRHRELALFDYVVHIEDGRASGGRGPGAQ